MYPAYRKEEKIFPAIERKKSLVFLKM